MSESNPFAAPEPVEASKEETVVDVPVSDSTESAPAPEVDAKSSEEVPAGTIKEVLSWVGEDKERAQAALDAEKASGKERATLVKSLEEVLEG